MADTTTTLSVSKKFHEWLKSKGSKGENYEDIIKKLLKPEFVKEVSSMVTSVVLPKNEHSTPYVRRNSKKKPGLSIDAGGTINKMPEQSKPKQKEIKKLENTKTAATSKTRGKSGVKKTGSKHASIDNEKLKQHKYEKNLELQGLNIELELAKLSNNTAKVKELSSSIAKLQESTEQ